MTPHPISECPICETGLIRGIHVTEKGENYPADNLYAFRPYSPDWTNDEIKCPRCGDFHLTRDGYSFLINKKLNQSERNILSYWVRNKSREAEQANNSENFKNALDEAYLPSPNEQADNLLVWISDRTANMGDYVYIDPYVTGSDIGAFGFNSCAAIFVELREHGYLSGQLITFPKNNSEWMSDKAVKAALTLSGWKRVDEIRRGNSESKIVFMAMQFGDIQLDAVVNNYIRPVISEIGYVLRRLDDDQKAGLIDDHLRLSIQSAKFVLVDLTHDNSGAYWEAGYAEGLGKTVIYTCNSEKFKKNKTHFDTNHHLHVLWDLDDMDKFIRKLKDTILISIDT